MRKYLDRFSEWLVGFGIEPYLHIVCTLVIAVMIARVCYFTGADRTLAGYIGALLAFLVDFVKESWDNKTEGCMYDKVSGVLFHNGGTGSFTYGNDVSS